MMTSNLYICAFEQKLTHKEATTRDFELKEDKLMSKDQKIVKNLS